MKQILKDTQISLRVSSEIAKNLKECAYEDNLSLADYIVKIFKESQNKNDLEERVRALENVVFKKHLESE